MTKIKTNLHIQKIYNSALTHYILLFAKFLKTAKLIISNQFFMISPHIYFVNGLARRFIC